MASAVSAWWSGAAGSFWRQQQLGKDMGYSQMYQRSQEFITGAQRKLPPHLAPEIQLDV